ncbi:MAG: phosphatidylserine decarboxylase family protein [Planctomycetota bacterium]|jgi:phosphatidylserine decarboxylase
MDEYSWSDPPSPTAFPVAKAGYPFIVAGAFATILFALLGLTALGLIGILLTLFVILFFRDPDRVIPNSKGLVVSPADGKVIAVRIVDRSPYYEGAALKISIFMSVFNVHINRMPCEGQITKINYHPGKFFAANLDKASKDNERNAVFLETPEQKKICTVQIAGLVARRIICYLKDGDSVVRGQRFGLICFGSRVDVYIPPDATLIAAVGDGVKAGTSVLGELK